MLSPNEDISKAYFATLSTITYLGNPIPVYKNELPTTIAPGIYIIFGRIRNNDIGNKTSPATQTSVTVFVYTNMQKYNDGVAVDIVANEVLNRILNKQAFNIIMPHDYFQVINSTLQSDFTQDFSQDKQNTYIDRVLIFNHQIFQNVS